MDPHRGEFAMRIVAILALPALMATAPDPAPVKPVCQNSAVQKAEQRKAPVGPHKLTAEPPAKQVLTVLRTVDGCSTPVVIRDDVGEAPRL
jgi:hypothetical protein